MTQRVTAVQRIGTNQGGYGVQWIDLFTVDPQGKAQTAWWRGGPNWAGWGQVRGGIFSPGTALSAIARDEKSIDLFGVGTDGKVYTAWWREGQGWEGWGTIGSKIFTQRTTIAAVSKDNDSIDLFAVDPNGWVQTAWWRAGQGWNGWAHIGSMVFPLQTPIAAVSKDSGSIDLYAVGDKGLVHSAWWRSGSHNWAGWAPVGSSKVFPPLTQIAAISTGLQSEGIDLYAVGDQGRAWSAWWREGHGWAGWDTIGSGVFTQGTPITALFQPVATNRWIDLFAVGEQEGLVYDAPFRGSTWSDWAAIAAQGFPQLTPVDAVASSDGSTFVFATDGSGTVYYNILGSAGWGPWVAIP